MIGIFDSGIGGLTVLRELHRLAPDLDIVYVGDTANIPYGRLTPATLEQLTVQAFRLLRNEGAKKIVSACNSVSTAVIRPRFDLFGMENATVVEMVGPTVEYFKQNPSGRVAIIATPATIRAQVYQKEFAKIGLSFEGFSHPDLASAIEFGKPKKSIRPMIQDIVSMAASVDAETLVLGCTHYPFVREEFEVEIKRQGIDLQLFDPATVVAQTVVDRYGDEGTGTMRFIITKEETAFRNKVTLLFGQSNIQVYPRLIL